MHVGLNGRLRSSNPGVGCGQTQFETDNEA